MASNSSEPIANVTISTVTQCEPATISWEFGEPPLRLQLFTQETSTSSWYPLTSGFLNVNSTPYTSSWSGVYPHIIHVDLSGGQLEMVVCARAGVGIWVELTDHLGYRAQTPQSVKVGQSSNDGCLIDKPTSASADSDSSTIALVTALAATSLFFLIMSLVLLRRVTQLRSRLKNVLQSTIRLPDSPSRRTPPGGSAYRQLPTSTTTGRGSRDNLPPIFPAPFSSPQVDSAYAGQRSPVHESMHGRYGGSHGSSTLRALPAYSSPPSAHPSSLSHIPLISPSREYENTRSPSAMSLCTIVGKTDASTVTASRASVTDEGEDAWSSEWRQGDDGALAPVPITVGGGGRPSGGGARTSAGPTSTLSAEAAGAQAAANSSSECGTDESDEFYRRRPRKTN